ncbi:MAG: hypothetical protein M3P51_09305 [Chloroflexota bacterium]|nr:hypothetical protein [Chloroflexota bacterium]
MTIKASDEWKEHALHPEKSSTGDTAETVAPSERPGGDPDAVYGAETANLAPGAGVGSAAAQGGNPASGPRDDIPGPTTPSGDR